MGKLRLNVNFVSLINEIMFEVTIPIFVHTLESVEFEKIQELNGIDNDSYDIPTDLFTVKNITLYRIDAVDDNVDINYMPTGHTCIYYSGKVVISPLGLEGVKSIIRKAMGKNESDK